MLSARLYKANVELLSHRRWLQIFTATTHIRGFTRVTNRQSSAQRNAHSGPSIPQIRKVKPNGATYSANKKSRTKKRNTKTAENVVQATLTHEIPPQLQALRKAVQDLRIEQAAEIYYALEDKRILNRHDSRQLAQCLHHCFRIRQRTADAKDRREELDKLVGFGEELIKDVKRGHLAPHGRAHVHLIGFFKEANVRDVGVRFWTWLETQDDTYVNADVYGAAIELLAVHGALLSELESLYQQALQRFPSNFAAYHLSPEAILPNRDQTTTLPGIPMALLQGILTARLIHGETRNAYLALDTALRLYPDQVPPRWFTLFLEERPLLEAYTVFAIACRGGIVIPSNQFARLLTALRKSSNPSTGMEHALSVRSMLSALYMYASAGGKVTNNMITELVIVMTEFLRLRGVVDIKATKKQQLVNEVMDIIRLTLTVFARYGARPGLSSFNSIITNLGGYGRSKQLIGVALSDAKALGIEPNEVTMRSILTAAGLLGDMEFIANAWKALVQARRDMEKHPDATDFRCLLLASHEAKHLDFAKQEVESLMQDLPTPLYENLLSKLEDTEWYKARQDASQQLDVSLLLTEIKKIQSDLELIDGRTKHSPNVQDFSNYQLPMTLLLVASSFNLPDREMVALYDEQTTEQIPSSTPVATTFVDTAADIPAYAGSTVVRPSIIDHTTRHALTSTNIPFGVIRFENWKSVNWLLEQAEASDARFHKAVDEAIAAGTIPPARTVALSLASIERIETHGLSDMIAYEETKEREKLASQEEVQLAREHVLRLRGRNIERASS